MSFQLCYPQWKTKAVTFSYDDGQIYDRRLVQMFNRYGLKGTFHLNSGMLNKKEKTGEEFVTREELPELYKGHEIACHGVRHAYPTHLSQMQMVQEFYEDRCALEAYSGRIIRGCSYAFGEYDERVKETLKSLGFVYCRTVESTEGFRMPEDFLTWTPSFHHNDVFKADLERFIHMPGYMRIPLLYIWGHSFEFEREQTWEQMEKFCSKIAGQSDTWYSTNIEIVDYMTAARNLIFSADCTKVENPSKIPIYGLMDGKKVILQ